MALLAEGRSGLLDVVINSKMEIDIHFYQQGKDQSGFVNDD